MWCQAKKERGALDSCFGLVSPHQQSIPHSPIDEAPRRTHSCQQVDTMNYNFCISLLHASVSVRPLIMYTTVNTVYVIYGETECRVRLRVHKCRTYKKQVGKVNHDSNLLSSELCNKSCRLTLQVHTLAQLEPVFLTH